MLDWVVWEEERGRRRAYHFDVCGGWELEGWWKFRWSRFGDLLLLFVFVCRI